MTDKILLIYELVPEHTKPYVLDADSELGKLAVASAGQYINSTDTHDDAPVHRLDELLGDMKHLDPTKPIDGPFSKVVICGFIM